MKVPSLASLPLALSLALVSACSGGTPPDDGSTNDTGTGNDGSSTMDTGTPMDAAATDGPRMRDTGPEVSLDSAFTQCFVAVSPRTGSTSDTFTITGMGFLSAPMAALSISPEAGGSPIVSTTVTVSGGMFTYTVPGSMFSPGNYRVDVNDPSFTCSAFGPFTVN